eukprot:406501-Pyramimonas_sp.AAC.1
MAPKSSSSLDAPSSDDEPLVRGGPAPRDAPYWVPSRAGAMAAAGFRLTEPSALIPLAVDRATLCLTMEKDRA